MILHYFMDPLCGWCYGFSPVIQAFYSKYQSQLDLEVISGGMVKGEHEKPIGDMAPFLKKAYKDIEAVSGVTFGEKFLDHLDDGRMVLSSVPSSVAMAVFRSYQTGKDLEFVAAIQKSIYHDGVDPSDMLQFAQIAEGLGIDKNDFELKVSQDKFRKEAYDDFSVTQQFGVQGYPTIILFARDEYFLLSRGFTTLEHLEKTFNSVIHSV